MVTVTATDSLGASAASIPVTIMVTNVDEMPDVSGDEEADYAENGTGSVATYTASDPEGAAVKWSLGGDDDSDFMIDNGVLSFKKSPDYESPMGGTDGTLTNTYEVDGPGNDETRRIASEDRHGRGDQRGRSGDGHPVGAAAPDRHTCSPR